MTQETFNVPYYKKACQSITWFIPKSVWEKISFQAQKELDKSNDLVTYPCDVGQGRTWIATKSFGELYKFEGDVAGVERVYKLAPGLPDLIKTWNEATERSRNKTAVI